MALIKAMIGAAGSGTAPPLPSGIPVGADPDVQTISFDVQAYATTAGWGTIPAETGPTQEPIADQGAAGDGSTNDTAAVQASLDALPSTGGVLDLSQGLFAVFNNSDDVLNVGNKDNITIKGGGLGTGLRSHPSQTATGNGFDALIRYNPSTNNQNLVIRDCEFDGNDNTIVGITTQNDDGTWIIGNYFHDFNDGSTGNAQGAIRGINSQANNRIIGNYIKNINANSGSAGRGIWTTDLDCSGTVIAHNWVEDTGHSGIILHAEDGGSLNTIEYNTVIRAGETTGGACFKPELSGNANKATYDAPGVVISTYKRNYARVDFSISGQVDFGFQIETFNCEIIENLIEDCNRGFATFDEIRKVLIRDNIFKKMAEYAMYFDANETGQDKTGNVVQFNTMSGDGEGMDYGIFFFDWDNSPPNIFAFDDPVTITENKVVDGQVGQVTGTAAALDGYVNFTNTGNGPSGTGARNDLFQNTGQAPPTPSWMPDDHTTLLEWWNAGLGVGTSGADVTDWTGQEAGMVASPPATNPVFVASSINGKPGIDFNANSRLTAPANAALNNVWAKGTLVYMWVVLKLTGLGPASRIADKGYDGDNTGWRLRFNSGAIEFQINGSTDDMIIITSNTFSTGNHVIEMSWDEGSGQPTLRVDGSAESWSSGDTGAGFIDDSGTDFTIGGQTVNSTGQFDGEILEMWFAQDPGTEVTDARAYITSEYGLTA